MKKKTRSIYLNDKKFVKDFLFIEENCGKWTCKKYYQELLKLSQKAPDEIMIQAWHASILGDYGQALSWAEEKAYKSRAAKILRGLSKRLSGKASEVQIVVLNELYYHSFNFKAQYDLGTAFNLKHPGEGVFSIGVGGAEYAYQLFQRGQQKRAIAYAEKSVKAWKKLGERYQKHNPFYMLALALVGETEKAEKEFNESIKTDREYKEFKRFWNVYKKRILEIKNF